MIPHTKRTPRSRKEAAECTLSERLDDHPWRGGGVLRVFWLLLSSSAQAPEHPLALSLPYPGPILARHDSYPLARARGPSPWRCSTRPPLTPKGARPMQVCSHTRASGQLQSAASSRCLRQELVSKRSSSPTRHSLKYHLILFFVLLRGCEYQRWRWHSFIIDIVWLNVHSIHLLSTLRKPALRYKQNAGLDQFVRPQPPRTTPDLSPGEKSPSPSRASSPILENTSWQAGLIGN